MLLESGVAVGRGRKTIARKLPELLARDDLGLTPARRDMLGQCLQGWREAEQQAQHIDAQLLATAKSDERCRRLLAVPGVGPLTATALVAAVGNASEFGCGRDLAAWLGLVPRQHSTGGVPRLLSISKRGNTYLRWLFCHGGRSVREHLKREQHAWGPWITALEARMHPASGQLHRGWLTGCACHCSTRTAPNNEAPFPEICTWHFPQIASSPRAPFAPSSTATVARARATVFASAPSTSSLLPLCRPSHAGGCR